MASPVAALVLLFLPAVTAMLCANRFADWLYEPLKELITPLLQSISELPSLFASLLGGDYGLVAMFPFLIIYALPTIIAFSIIIAVYRSTGLIEHISRSLHPYLRVFGIGAKDLVRVVMGFGCNVPAIVASRACHSCSRGACVSAISFGSACSYQLPATLAVFAAAGIAYMGIVYLILLGLTTLIYLRVTTPKALRLANAQMKLAKVEKLRSPSYASVKEDLLDNLKQFGVMSIPIFVIICFTAAFLEWLGVLQKFGNLLSPVMSLFNLPGDAAMAVVLGSVRKDGIAVGLLDSDWSGMKVAIESPAQVLTAVYLAGVLLPCIVTLFTIAREMQWKFAIRLCARQMAWASGFSILIAWLAPVFFW